MRIIKNKKGSILTSLSLTAPVLISCMMLFISLMFFIRNHDLSQSICFKYNLQTQVKMKKQLKQLLELNPIAKSLRSLQKELERSYYKAVSASGPLAPVTAATLKTAIEVVKQKRRVLDKQQKQILNQSRSHIEQQFSLFKKEIRRFNPRYIKKDHHQPIPLAVVAKPRGSLAPTYHRATSFSTRQTIYFSWEMPLYNSLPKWLIKASFTSHLSKYDCASTLKKRGSGWQVNLIDSKRSYL